MAAVVVVTQTLVEVLGMVACVRLVPQRVPAAKQTRDLTVAPWPPGRRGSSPEPAMAPHLLHRLRKANPALS
ncbi:hypothetical protein [Streptomyces sp. NPDC056300]|uniref:hypothetical protein n=1 Tax=Streptomyces sp. NPDC056300 TaxID=3345777 RepID=UPI0035DACF7C